MQPESRNLTKLEISDHFAKLFDNEENTVCFQCGKKSRQWAETKHAIFLCLSCAANYKELGRLVTVKSISLDLWTELELATLKAGGNQQFRQLLSKYGLNEAEPRVFLRSGAANYYQRKLQCVISGKPVPEEPSLEAGKARYEPDIPITQMTSDQIIESAKMRATWLGGKTKEMGTKAYDKVHHKVTSGELKEDAKKAANKVSSTAKSIWEFMQAKARELRNGQDTQQLRERDSHQ